MPKEERTLVLIKPDAVQRNLVGEIIARFEKKGLRLAGVKMLYMTDAILKEHYAKHKDKPFFSGLAKFMSSTPVIALALSGMNAIKAVRLIVGPTKSYEADAGSIRGDLSISGQANVVHASDPEEDPEAEVKRFFTPEELFDYKKVDYEFVYGEEERGN